MIFLSGAFRDDLPEGVGVMDTFGKAHTLPADRLWAADNGCLTRPDRYDTARYLDWLADRPHQHNCLFATGPDITGDPEETLRWSADVLVAIRTLGYRAALVAQDGCTNPPWDEFDCLFIGGTTAWRLSENAYRLSRQARERGKWTHMGRVNSFRRFRAVRNAGYDSGDGTFLKFGPDINRIRLETWLADPQQGMAL